ncbi:MAG: selenide, water dikinase SelD [Pseudomonadales bacterium]|nr:selenide, water dikinase SelD [Pseudomonadales bacterium]
MDSKTANPDKTIRLTEYSHGAGCGCKISPAILDRILAGSDNNNDKGKPDHPALWVGNSSRDDAAVFGIDDDTGIVSTTDFFMPIVDDAFDFGRIAATNAISDIYAMGATPIMAIAILGWPVNLLPPEVAGKVIAGARLVCTQAGIPLAGGHSIDTPEPIFGLAVTGKVQRQHLKRNNTAQAGAELLLSKPLGIGILTTAEKQKKLRTQDQNLARDVMCQLNSFGMALARIPGVQAMTDVTGFGLLGHLVEMADGAGLLARLRFADIPLLPGVQYYLQEHCIPGGSGRNFASYGHRIGPLNELQKNLLCDPQTSGGLLLAVSPDCVDSVLQLAADQNQFLQSIGSMAPGNAQLAVEVL